MNAGADELIPPPPEGFERLESLGPFWVRNGPLFRRPPQDGEPELTQAVFILPRHANTFGVLHGGMLSTFLDSTLSHAVGRATGHRCVTVSLSIDFLKMARQGEWLIGEGRVTQVEGRRVLAEGFARIGDLVIGRATGAFQLMQRRG
jgi:uncharacterized protein (TIGR00369 family)